MFTKKIFKNGLRAIVVPMKDNPTVTILVLVETGSKYETKKINGISHFLEHMCFKGTIFRPTAFDISKELDALGSRYNAFTSQEYTGYYAKSNAKHFKQIFNVVSDIYLNSIFANEEIQKERGVILEEKNMYQDMPKAHVQDVLIKLLYGDQPAGWNIIGEKKSIMGVTRDDFLEYKKAHYVPSATVVIVAGQVKEKDAFNEINKAFSQVPNDLKFKKEKVTEKQDKPQALIEFKKTDQTHFVLGLRSYNLFSKKNPGLAILSTILAGGMSSRLFQILREELGVCYYVNSDNEPFTDHGVFQIASGVDNKRVEEVIKVILMECKRLKNEQVKDEELNRIKEYMIGNMKLSLESTDQVANFYGGQELLKKEIKIVEEKEKEIRQVTSNQINLLANDIFENEKLNLALIGPFEPKEKSKFLKILKI